MGRQRLAQGRELGGPRTDARGRRAPRRFSASLEGAWLMKGGSQLGSDAGPGEGFPLGRGAKLAGGSSRWGDRAGGPARGRDREGRRATRAAGGAQAAVPGGRGAEGRRRPRPSASPDGGGGRALAPAGECARPRGAPRARARARAAASPDWSSSEPRCAASRAPSSQPGASLGFLTPRVVRRSYSWVATGPWG